MSRYRYRRHHLWVSLLLIGISWLVFYGQQHGWLSSAGKGVVAKQPGQYSINHFVDGDTISVNMNGHAETVRFIGVDTPETHKPNTPVQCYGPAAAAYTKNTIGTKTVRLVSDPLSTDRDRYGRLLRYVYLPDGTNLDQAIIENGYGFYYPYFPFTKSAAFAAAEQRAMAAHKGLWSNCQPIAKDGGGFQSNPQ
jgi:micrococcal nuclease